MNRNLFVYLMKKNGDSIKLLACALGCKASDLIKKIYEKENMEFRFREIIKVKNRYNLSKEDMMRVFFNKKVS